MYFSRLQWRNRGHFHCWSVCWFGHGNYFIWILILMCWASPTLTQTSILFSHEIFTAFDQGQIKTGAPCRSERLAKYNQVRTSISLFCVVSLPLFLWIFSFHSNFHVVSWAWYWPFYVLVYAALAYWGGAWFSGSLCWSKIPRPSRTLLEKTWTSVPVRDLRNLSLTS